MVSVDNRLAPEHRLEDAIDDCVAAATWLAEHAPVQFGTDALLVGGPSAGAHLAVATLLRLRDRGLGRWLGANLEFGCYDLSEASGLEAGEAIERHVLRGRSAPEARAPDVSPLYADLAGLPPALFTVGTLDPLLDDSVRMAARWREAGIPAELALDPGSEHGFSRLPTDAGRAARARRHRWLRDRLPGPPAQSWS